MTGRGRKHRVCKFTCYTMDGNEGSGYKPFTYLSYEFLNAFTELDSRMDDDKLFHSFAPLTQKKFFLRSRLVRRMDNGMNDCWCLYIFGQEQRNTAAKPLNTAHVFGQEQRNTAAVFRYFCLLGSKESVFRGPPGSAISIRSDFHNYSMDYGFSRDK